MKLIRNLVAGSAAACAVIALALAPTPALAEESHSTVSKTAPKLTFMAIATAPSAACLTARQALTTAWTNDRDEDTSERQAAKLAGADPTVDVNEDKNEKAVLKALWDTERTVCAGQPATPPSANCVSAKQALKDALAAAKTAEKAEKTSGAEASTSDQSEDKTEAAALKPLLTAVGTACGFPSAKNHFAFADRR